MNPIRSHRILPDHVRSSTLHITIGILQLVKSHSLLPGRVPCIFHYRQYPFYPKMKQGWPDFLTNFSIQYVIDNINHMDVPGLFSSRTICLVHGQCVPHCKTSLYRSVVEVVLLQEGGSTSHHHMTLFHG